MKPTAEVKLRRSAGCCPKCGDCPGNQAQGAARERRRIRRAQREALEGVRLLLAKLDDTPDLDAAISFTGSLDAATRAKPRKR